MRILEVVAATVAFVLLLPVMALIAIAIRVVAGGPVLFRQRRAGRWGRPFTIWKFRTMDMRDARCCGDPERCIGLQMAPGTPVPRLFEGLRRSGLDELPQLVNVIAGHMSVVGPRPLMLRYTDRYTKEQRRRLDVRPGITGWAQVSGRTDLEWDARLALDVWYVAHRSVRLDLEILARTVRVAVLGSGFSQSGSHTGYEFQGIRPRDGRCPAADEPPVSTERAIVSEQAT